MKGQALFSAILTALFGWLKHNHTMSKLNKKRKQLISDRDALVAVNSFLFKEKYFGEEKYIHSNLKENIKGLLEHDKSVEEQSFGLDKNDNNLWIYALFLRQAIMLKYLISKGIHKELDEQLSYLDDVEARYESERLTLGIEAMANESKIINYFNRQLTPELKKIFDSLDIRVLAYDDNDLSEYGEVQEKIVEDMMEAYTLWIDRNVAIEEERDEDLEKKGFSLDKAVDMLQLDSEFTPIMKSLIDDILKRPDSDASTRKLWADGEVAVDTYFKEKGMNYQQTEIETIWATVWSDDAYTNSFVNGGSISDSEEGLQPHLTEPVKIKSHAIKIFSEDPLEDEIDFALKIILDNPTSIDEITISVEGHDEDDFEVLSFMMTGSIKPNSETSLSERFSWYSYSEYSSVTTWKFQVLAI